jgi:hypothetical protein
VVPLGVRAKGLQPDDAAWKHFVARVLGAHRIRLWKVFDFAERPMQRMESDGGVAGDFSFDAGAFLGAHRLEEGKA